MQAHGGNHTAPCVLRFRALYNDSLANKVSLLHAKLLVQPLEAAAKSAKQYLVATAGQVFAGITAQLGTHDDGCTKAFRDASAIVDEAGDGKFSQSLDFLEKHCVLVKVLSACLAKKSKSDKDACWPSSHDFADMVTAQRTAKATLDTLPREEFSSSLS